MHLRTHNLHQQPSRSSHARMYIHLSVCITYVIRKFVSVLLCMYVQKEAIILCKGRLVRSTGYLVVVQSQLVHF